LINLKVIANIEQKTDPHYWNMEEAESTSREEFYHRVAREHTMPSYNYYDRSPEDKGPAPEKHDDFFDLFKR
jgi:hypothetical protein